MSIEELPIPDEFWTNKTIDKNDCWIWQGKTNPAGYGIINVFGAQVRVYRLSLILSTKKDPRGMHACHKPNICFSKACYNPEHLYWGTAAENGRDKRGTKYDVSAVCIRGHNKEIYHDKYSRCIACTILKAVARKNGVVSRVHQRKLEKLNIDLSQINLDDYK